MIYSKDDQIMELNQLDQINKEKEAQILRVWTRWSYSKADSSLKNE